jgi:aspartate/methionine/tyrosine aminotransferase
VPIADVGESRILTLIDRISELRQAGETVLPLHIGEPEFPTPPGIEEAAYRAMQGGLTHYSSPQGMHDLREAIAERVSSRFEVPAEAQDVIVLPAKLAIYATILATLDPGDEVVLPEPTYLFEQPILLAGGRPVYVPTRPDHSLDLDAIAAAITERSRLLFLVSPANPTGKLLRRDELRAVVDIASDHGLTIASDETYSSMLYEGTHVAPASLAPPEVAVVTIGSFSKSYAMTGWRAGYAVAPPPIMHRLVSVVEHTVTCVPPFVQRACLWALANAEADAIRFREQLRERRDHLLARLDDLPGLSYVQPQGALYVFPKYEVALSSAEFATRLLDEEHVAIVPGVAFGPHGEGHIRLSFTSPLDVLDEAMVRLGRFLEARGAARG